jgi:hypothetical protein
MLDTMFMVLGWFVFALIVAFFLPVVVVLVGVSLAISLAFIIMLLRALVEGIIWLVTFGK